MGMSKHADPGITTEPAYGYFGVFYPEACNKRVEYVPIHDIDSVLKIAQEIRPGINRSIMKAHAEGARLRYGDDQAPEVEQHKEMFAWTIQSDLLLALASELDGEKFERVMALAYLLCEHLGTRAFVIIARHYDESEGGEPYPDQYIKMPAAPADLTAEALERFTREWVNATLSKEIGQFEERDSKGEANQNLSTLENLALAQQAQAIISELLTRLETPLQLLPNEQLRYQTWLGLQFLAIRDMLQIKVKKGRRYVMISPSQITFSETDAGIEIQINSDQPKKQ
jgi:hypothetical protein